MSFLDRNTYKYIVSSSWPVEELSCCYAAENRFRDYEEFEHVSWVKWSPPLAKHGKHLAGPSRNSIPTSYITFLTFLTSSSHISALINGQSTATSQNPK